MATKMKTCYYELLGVDRKATEDDIKKAYKKQALKYHPDKNREVDTKEIFQSINKAYEVLIDGNERAWYDSHREQILRGKEGQEMSKDDLEQASYGFNIWPYFSTSCFKGFDDSEKGFYQVYSSVFERLANEEQNAYKFYQDGEDEDKKPEYISPPEFSDSKQGPEAVAAFYKFWSGFTSYKSFSWCDSYNLTEAQNRWVKRQMEKENKKDRFKGKKEYLKIIRELVEFVQRRDPRWREYVESRGGTLPQAPAEETRYANAAAKTQKRAAAAEKKAKQNENGDAGQKKSKENYSDNDDSDDDDDDDDDEDDSDEDYDDQDYDDDDYDREREDAKLRANQAKAKAQARLRQRQKQQATAPEVDEKTRLLREEKARVAAEAAVAFLLEEDKRIAEKNKQREEKIKASQQKPKDKMKEVEEPVVIPVVVEKPVETEAEKARRKKLQKQQQLVEKLRQEELEIQAIEEKIRLEEEAEANPVQEEWATSFASKKAENKYYNDLAIKKKLFEKQLKEKKQVLDKRKAAYEKAQLARKQAQDELDQEGEVTESTTEPQAEEVTKPAAQKPKQEQKEEEPEQGEEEEVQASGPTKAQLKKEKKEAQMAANPFGCKQCSSRFQTKSKMLSHAKQTGHKY